MKRAVPLLLMLALTATASAAHAAYSPSAPPSYWTGPTPQWTDLYNRADYFAGKASTLVNGANVTCLRSVLISILVKAEIEVAQDIVTKNPWAADRKPYVDPKRGPFIRKQVHAQRDSDCNPPNGGSPAVNLEAFAKLAGLDEGDWQVARFPGEIGREKRIPGPIGLDVDYLYEAAKPLVQPSTPSILELLKLGILVPAMQGAEAAAAGLSLPIINPKLLMPKTYDPRDGA